MILKRQHSMKCHGFTLIELIIIIVIIMIIASVAIPTLGDYYDQAKIANIKATLAKTRTVLARFYATKATVAAGRYPTYAEFTAAAPNTVYDQPLLGNPYANDSNTVRQWLPDDGTGDPMILIDIKSEHGWNYYPDGNVFDGRIFWANSYTYNSNAL